MRTSLSGKGVALAGLLVFVAGLALRPMAESDLFFRIEAGRQILAREVEGTRSSNARAAYERAMAAPAGCLSPADERPLAAWLGAVALGEGNAAAALARLDRSVAPAGPRLR